MRRRVPPIEVNRVALLSIAIRGAGRFRAVRFPLLDCILRRHSLGLTHLVGHGVSRLTMQIDQNECHRSPIYVVRVPVQ